MRPTTMVKSDFGYNSKVEGEVIVTRADAVVKPHAQRSPHSACGLTCESPGTVASSTPSKRRRGRVPVKPMMDRAMRRWRFHCCIAAAIAMPPAKIAPIASEPPCQDAARKATMASASN